MKSLTLVTMTTFVLSANLFAQHDHKVEPCGLHHYTEELFSAHPHLRQEAADTEATLEKHTKAFEQSQQKAGVVYIIPVVFHIIHNNGPENISDEQVRDAIRVLNEDFRKLNPDANNVVSAFQSIVADCEIEFALATKDPSGNCHKGITRTESIRTYDGDQAMKNLIQWDRSMYMNVWVCSTIGTSSGGGIVAGYTQYPSSVSGFPQADGIVMRSNYVGAIGTSNASRSRTLSHEVGHWINLRHTWGNSNNANLSTNCTQDDLVNDTPNTIGWQSCNLNAQSCGSLDNVENYMDYAGCRKMFTMGQATRMRAALTSSISKRKNLWSASNLIATGTNPTQPLNLCNIEFKGDKTTICAGESITFSDYSYHWVTSRTWTFNGGLPASSSNQVETVTFNTPGIYSITLNVSDGSTSLSDTKTDYIIVLPDVGHPAPYSEGFESMNSISDDLWYSENIASNTSWEVTNNIAFIGNKSVKLNNIANSAGSRNILTSTTIDLSSYSEANLSFKYAFAQRNSSDDELWLRVSRDCGDTWAVRWHPSGNNLATTNQTNSFFTPTNDSQWETVTVFIGTNTPNNNYMISNFRFQFELESDGGNNVYIDDINITGVPLTSGLAENQLFNSFNVFPNPTNGETTVQFDLINTTDLTLTIYDVVGKAVKTIPTTSFNSGSNQVNINLEDQSQGVYFLELQAGELRITKKVLLN